MFKNIVSILALVIVFVLGCVQPSDALFSLELDDINDNNPSILIIDNQAGDSLSIPGGITYYGQIGIFSLNITTAFSKPLIGQNQPELLLSSLGVSSNGPGTIKIRLTETGFSPFESASFTSYIGGTLSGNLTLNNYLNSTNIGSFGPYNAPGDFSDSYTTTLGASQTYSLVTEVILTHESSGNTVSSFSSHLVGNTMPVAPEPVSSLLFITGGALLTGRRFLGFGKNNTMV